MNSSDKIYIGLCLLISQAYIFCRRAVIMGLMRLSIWAGVCLLPRRKSEHIITCSWKGKDVTYPLIAYLALDETPSLTGFALFMRSAADAVTMLALISVYKRQVFSLEIPCNGGAYSRLQVAGPTSVQSCTLDVLFGGLRIKDLYKKTE
jgi:hypothetical protein